MRAVLLLTACLLAACSRGVPQPVAIDPRHDTCAHCRMLVSDVRIAAQIVAPGEEPQLFDDIGCLRDALATITVSRDAVIYVADRRTGSWVAAAGAVYTQTSAKTPMGSGIVAHADAASRDADRAAAGGRSIGHTEILRGLSAREGKAR